MPDPRPIAPAESPAPSADDLYTGEFTAEELTAAGRSYEGETFTLEEVLDYARRAVDAANGAAAG